MFSTIRRVVTAISYRNRKYAVLECGHVSGPHGDSSPFRVATRQCERCYAAEPKTTTLIEVATAEPALPEGFLTDEQAQEAIFASASLVIRAPFLPSASEVLGLAAVVHVVGGGAQSSSAWVVDWLRGEHRG